MTPVAGPGNPNAQSNWVLRREAPENHRRLHVCPTKVSCNDFWTIGTYLYTSNRNNVAWQEFAPLRSGLLPLDPESSPNSFFLKKKGLGNCK